MKIQFILLGKAKEPFLKEGYQEYLKRLSGYAKTSLVFLPEEPLNENPSSLEIEKALDNEALRALNQLKDNDLLILLDLHGKEYTSEEFALILKNEIDHGASSLVFLVGSSCGISDLLRKRAAYKVSFGKMTTTHPLALLLSMEQVYRAFKINSGEKYHK
ncbi:MAG: 23S rRNA (pseudouridine(1915)-N(3))-methyltransferase RlmH [Bacilli bacterium]|jgi:23S rRNA (pseudouridine1915-N3)-methyltransferase|nr:23S rRNA (pseudouridine(1915)-N(3))-methyltransferase RlmH [Bacilli bacterium]